MRSSTATAPTTIPTPKRAPLDSPKSRGAGLEAVAELHWSERLPVGGTAPGDVWMWATPIGSSGLGLLIRTYGVEALVFLAAAVLAVLIVASLLVKEVGKFAKRRRRVASQ